MAARLHRRATGLNDEQRVAAEVERRAMQQRALAELGQAALSRIDIDILLGQTCALVESVIATTRCAIIALDGERLEARAAVGSSLGFDACNGNHPAHRAFVLWAMEAPGAIAFRNLPAEPRFDGAHLVDTHGVQAGMAVRIRGRTQPFGVIAALHASDRTFPADELEFLEAVADLTGAMIESARAERALAESESRFRSLVENSSDGILLVNAHGVIEYAGPSTRRILGYNNEELVGTKVVSVVHPDDAPRLVRNQEQLLVSQRATVKDELRVLHAGGAWIWVEALAQNLLTDHAVSAIVINYRDVTGRRQAEKELERLAYRDSLTGLPNRFLFHDRLRHALEQGRRRKRGVGVMYLDLDRFKLVNDSLGHATGDELLQQVSTRLAETLRSDDTIARLGGDEFAVILTDAERAEDAGQVGTKILQALRKPFSIGEHQLYATASIGISIYPDDGEDVATLLRNADAALYRAKELGRNAVQLFAASMNERFAKRLQIEQQLRRAVEREEFVLYYQPIIDRATRSVQRVEALLRWRREDGTIVGPGEFIGAAEETGLILPIGEWVFSQACQDLRKWRAQGIDIDVSVNLSAHQIQQNGLIHFIAETIERAGIPPSSIELEVTESAAMQNLQWSLSVLEQLRSFGVRIAVDDFGTGQSSLAYLKQFPLDTVKIDREFLRDLREPQDAAILASIVTLGHSLGLYVIAEGVETQAELELLAAHGCDGLQGYLLGRPAPPDDIARIVRSFSGPRVSEDVVCEVIHRAS